MPIDPNDADTVDVDTIAPTDPLPPTDPPPTTFGKYDLLGELGRGGMGVVYKARERDLDRVVAVKMILSSQFAGSEQVQRFYAEARACAKLPHLHIVQVFEVGELHGQPYFAMEYIEGRGLDSRIHERPLDPDEAVQLLIPIARAVGHLHAHGIVHRDLKPGNVLIDRAGRPVLTDFGLAKILADTESQLTNTGAILGTPSYMAPEQAAAKPVTPATDVYSLGAILYECLTGRPPFRAATPLDTIVQVLESEPTLIRHLRKDVPRSLDLICLKCLEKHPLGRYADALALADDLQRYLNGESITAQPESVWQQGVRWARREVGLAAHLAAIAGGAVFHEVGYLLNPSLSAAAHGMVLAILFLLAMLSIACQRLLRRPGWSEIGALAWCALDGIALTAMLAVAKGFDGPLVVLYPLYIVASGLWWRVRLVWLSTILSQIGYIAIVTLAWLEKPELDRPQQHGILLIAMGIMGYIISYQVHRVRLLSRHFDQRNDAVV